MKRIAAIAVCLSLIGIFVSAYAPQYANEPRMAVWVKSLHFLLGVAAFLTIGRLDARRVLSRHAGLLLVIMALQLAAILVLTQVPRYKTTPEDSGVLHFAAVALSRVLSEASLLTLFALPIILAKPLARGVLRCSGDTELHRFIQALLPAFVVGMLVLACHSVATFIAVVLISLIMAWLAGHRLPYVAGLALLLIVCPLVIAFFWAPIRMARILDFYDYLVAPSGSHRAVRVTEALITDGGLWGRGVNRRTYAGWLVRGLCDHSAFAYVGHVAGLWGACLVTVLFTSLGWLGLRIAAKARTPRHRVCAAGIVLCVLLPAFGSIWDNAGLSFIGDCPLPFVSSEVGSLLLPWCALGLVMSLSRRKGNIATLASSETRAPLPFDSAAFMRRIHVLQLMLALIALVTFARLWFLANRWSP